MNPFSFLGELLNIKLVYSKVFLLLSALFISSLPAFTPAGWAAKVHPASNSKDNSKQDSCELNPSPLSGIFPKYFPQLNCQLQKKKFLSTKRRITNTTRTVIPLLIKDQITKNYKKNSSKLEVSFNNLPPLVKRTAKQGLLAMKKCYAYASACNPKCFGPQFTRHDFYIN